MPEILNQRFEAEVDIDSIQPHPKNPRKSILAPIAESIEAHGFYGAIIVHEPSGYILVGSHRWRAAKKAGAKTIPVVFVDVDSFTARKIMLVDNRSSDAATYNDNVLEAALQEVRSAGSLDGTGFTEKDYQAILKSNNSVDVDTTKTKNKQRDEEMVLSVGRIRHVLDVPSYERTIAQIKAQVGDSEEAVIDEIRRRLGL